MNAAKIKIGSRCKALYRQIYVKYIHICKEKIPVLEILNQPTVSTIPNLHLGSSVGYYTRMRYAIWRTWHIPGQIGKS